MGYYQVKVKFTLDEGKKSNVNYLVDALSCIEAETKIISYLTSREENNFNVASISESSIVEVLHDH
jgi:hypothetical protein